MKTRYKRTIMFIIILFCVIPANVCGNESPTDTLILINNNHKLSENYVPNDMKNIAGKVKSDKSELFLTAEAADAFVLMYNQMAIEGLTDLTAVSGYRTFAYQNTLFNNKISEYEKNGYDYDSARELTRRYIAPAGESEHQAGLAVDVSTTGELTEEFKNTKEGIWLINNSYKYGFIVRYNADKESVTGIAYEPWHFRYVGLPHSQIMYEQNLCLEKYLEKYTPPAPLPKNYTESMKNESEAHQTHKIKNIKFTLPEKLPQIIPSVMDKAAQYADKMDLHTLIILLWGINIALVLTLAFAVLRTRRKTLSNIEN